MDARPPAMAKRLWHNVRVVFFMLRKGLSKRKLMVDLHLVMKRGKIAGKAIGKLMFHHHSGFSCRTRDPHLAFFPPSEYEFSCSNSPAFSFFHLTKRSKNNCPYDDVAVSAALQKTFEMLGSDRSAVASPAPVSWYGRSPTVRQLRITDSPFPVQNGDEECHVDKDAEEFIAKFYEQLRLQKRMAALEATYHEEVSAE